MLLYILLYKCYCIYCFLNTADEDMKSLLELFFAEKDKNFFERGIMKLPEKWQKIIKQNGQYIV
ncbi:hypothetical protein X777_06191 [Ooceraea biroi]|uniref:Mariner Mos1 transposase n=1 Tax=Ooceraea biroi TaxID=2015173 RepID=A0A026WDW2_OOCBI|nr:hypothetical protein X777_06191 [Ooceraea biroi]